jgi:Winged helix-turn helix
MLTPIQIDLTREERQELESRARGLRAAHRDVVRAKIILRVAQGQPLAVVAREVGRQRKVVRKWAQRFVKKRLLGLIDKSGRGRAPDFSPCRGHDTGEARVRAA